MRFATYQVITTPTQIRYNGDDLEEACATFRRCFHAGYEVELWEDAHVVAWSDQVHYYARHNQFNILFTR